MFKDETFYESKVFLRAYKDSLDTLKYYKLNYWEEKKAIAIFIFYHYKYVKIFISIAVLMNNLK